MALRLEVAAGSTEDVENFCAQLFKLCRFRPMLNHVPTITEPLEGNLASRSESFQLDRALKRRHGARRDLLGYNITKSGEGGPLANSSEVSNRISIGFLPRLSTSPRGRPEGMAPLHSGGSSRVSVFERSAATCDSAGGALLPPIPSFSGHSAAGT